MGSLSKFFELIYGDQIGYLFTTSQPENPSKGNYWEWPKDKNRLLDYCATKEQAGSENYFTPALFDTKSMEKGHAVGSRVCWLDYDRKDVPFSWDILPTAHVETSEGKSHTYWRLNSFATPGVVEQINDALIKEYGGDPGTWNINRLLRVPGSWHKKDEPHKVQLKFIVSPDFSQNPVVVVDRQWFKGLPEKVQNILKNPNKDRSSKLQASAHVLAESGWTDERILESLRRIDARFGKYKDRSDAETRYQELLDNARAKTPYKEALFQRLIPYRLDDLLAEEIQLEWLFKDVMLERTLALVDGPTGVGKSRLSLAMAFSLASGIPFLEFVPTKPKRRVVYMSLEMGDAECKQFLEIMAESLDAETRRVINDQMLIYPVGQSLPAYTEEGRQFYMDVISNFEPDVIFFDTVSASTNEVMKEEATGKAITDFMMWLQSDFPITPIMVGHSNKDPRVAEDTYGSVFLAHKCATIIRLLQEKNKDGSPRHGKKILEYVKTRGAAQRKALYLEDGPNLSFVPRSREPETVEFKNAKDVSGSDGSNLETTIGAIRSGPKLGNRSRDNQI